MSDPVNTTNDVITRIWDMASYSDKLSLSQAIQIFRDNWRQIIRAEINNLFDSQEARDRLCPLVTTELNVAKTVIEKTALVYKKPAKRWAEVVEVKNADGEMEGVDNERYDELVEESQLDHVMQAANEYTRLVNHVLLRPVVRSGKMCVDIILPDNFDIYTAPDDFMEIVAIRYYVGSLQGAINAKIGPAQTQDTRESVMWVKSPMLFTQGDETAIVNPGIYHIRSKEKINDWLKTFEENPYFTTDEKENVEYILPFVLTHKDFPIDRLLNFSNGSSMTESAVMFAVLMTQANELMKYQAYKLLVLSAPGDINVPDGMKVGPGIALKMPHGGSINSVDFQAAIKEFVQSIHDRVATFMAQQGIPPSAFTLTGQPQSGYSLKIDRSTLVEIRDKEIPNYRHIENCLFDMMRVVNNHSYAEIKEKLIPDSAEFHIDYAEMGFDPSPDEQMRKDTFGLANNLITPVDIIMRDNPDLSEDDALTQWMKNKATVAQRTATPLRQPGQVGSDGKPIEQPPPVDNQPA